MLINPKGAALSAAWFWSVNKCGPLADSGDFVALTKKINGGTIGLADREKRYRSVLAVI
jgi:putative chitinase